MKQSFSQHMPDEIRMAYDQMARYAEDFQTTVQQLKAYQRELESAYIDTIHRLAMAVEYKDEETGNHVARISYYSALLAHYIHLPTEQIQHIFHAAPMHDVGKISIPDAILLKPAKLTEQEYEVMKTHTTAGADILANSKSVILEVARIIALNHHERWDGKGYPAGLSGSDIPIEGRIVGLVDVFDALLSQRPYKQAFSLEKTICIINSEKGKHFDPDLVDVFIENLDEIMKITEVLRTSNATTISGTSCEDIPECTFFEELFSTSETKHT